MEHFVHDEPAIVNLHHGKVVSKKLAQVEIENFNLSNVYAPVCISKNRISSPFLLQFRY